MRPTFPNLGPADILEYALLNLEDEAFNEVSLATFQEGPVLGDSEIVSQLEKEFWGT